MHPFLVFSLGGLTVTLTTYNLAMLLAFCAVTGFGWLRRGRAGLDGDAFWGLMTAVVLGGAAGAKLFYVVSNWGVLGPGLAEKAGAVLAGFSRGWGYYGGLAGAAAAASVYLRRRGLPVLATADLFAPAAALGNAVMRLGCFCAGCCYGRPSDAPWAVTFPQAYSRVPEALRGVPLHPSQLYESLGNLLLFFALLSLGRSAVGRIRTGGLFLLYAAGYSALRLLTEIFRMPQAGWAGGATAGQQFAAVTLVLSVFAYRLLPRS